MKKIYRCECGYVTGELCSWQGPASLRILIECMPEDLRRPYPAAADGVIRLAVHRECVDRIEELKKGDPSRLIRDGVARIPTIDLTGRVLSGWQWIKSDGPGYELVKRDKPDNKG